MPSRCSDKVGDFIFFQDIRVALLNSILQLTDASFRETGKVRPVARVVPDQTAVSAATFCRTFETQMR